MKKFSYAVLADVHGNLAALAAVLHDIGKRDVQDILFLGDAVGYGPQPVECLRLLQSRCKVLVAGNHDWAVVGRASLERFSERALLSLELTAGLLSEDDIACINGFDLVRTMEEESIFLVHSSPRDPESWGYVLSERDVEESFGCFSERICLLGHSHVPFIVERQPSSRLRGRKRNVAFAPGCRYIINVGSVGMPRDGDPRASYAVVTSAGAEIVRVGYRVGSGLVLCADNDAQNKT